VLLNNVPEPSLSINLNSQTKCIVGVNNRDLGVFTVDLQTSVRLKAAMPEGIIAVAESGMKRKDDILMIQNAGFDAVLIGEGLLTACE
jgi:indole-3-glycerol phosphate synthase